MMMVATVLQRDLNLASDWIWGVGVSETVQKESNFVLANS